MTRLARAIANQNLLLIRSAAAELKRVSLSDALAILAVIAVKEPANYEVAAVRWLGRLCLETRGLTLEQADVALGALAGLPAEPELREELSNLVAR